MCDTACGTQTKTGADCDFSATRDISLIGFETTAVSL